MAKKVDPEKFKRLQDYPESIKIAYLKVFSLILSVDGVVEPSESAELYRQYAVLNISDEGRVSVNEVLSAQLEADPKSPTIIFSNLIAELKYKLQTIPENERQSIIYGLYTDMVAVEKQALHFDAPERTLLDTFRMEFWIKSEEADCLEQKVENDLKLVKGEITEQEYLKAAKKLSAAATGLGIPLAALFFSGTIGFSAVGITSGLATIGLIAGGGMIPGIGVLIVGGVATYKLIEWLSGAKQRELRNKREALLKSILEVHQMAISLIMKDLNKLSDKIIQVSQTAEKNSALIDKLNKQMTLLKQTEFKARETNNQLETMLAS